MRKTPLIAVLTALLLSACSSTEPETAAVESNEAARADGYRCERETVTGSRFPVKRCTTAAQREAEAAQAKETMRNIRSNVGGGSN